jgi:hypothetical protein
VIVMPFLDFIKNRNAPAQQAVAPTPQAQTPAAKSIESLPDHVKSAAVEAARPTVETAGSGAAPKDAPVQPQATPRASRGRSLQWER